MLLSPWRQREKNKVMLKSDFKVYYKAKDMYKWRKRLNEKFGYEDDDNAKYDHLPAYLRDFKKECDKLSSVSEPLKLRGSQGYLVFATASCSFHSLTFA
jgi:hypothetical protein